VGLVQVLRACAPVAAQRAMSIQGWCCAAHILLAHTLWPTVRNWAVVLRCECMCGTACSCHVEWVQHVGFEALGVAELCRRHQRMWRHLQVWWGLRHGTQAWGSSMPCLSHGMLQAWGSVPHKLGTRQYLCSLQEPSLDRA
jgi:hypothetical protein